MMRFLSLAALILVSTFNLSHAQVSELADRVSANAMWDAPLQGTPTGYKIHLGDSSGVYHTVTDVGLRLAHRLDNLEPGRKYFVVVTAYNAKGSGPLSDEVEFTPNVIVDLSKVENFKILEGVQPTAAPARTMRKGQSK